MIASSAQAAPLPDQSRKQGKMNSLDLGTIIAQAIEDARGAGFEPLEQRKRAVEAVRSARPDIPANEAATLVEVRLYGANRNVAVIGKKPK
jgi:hypothetical protein